MTKLAAEVAERVERERASNEGDDIIGRAHDLKQRFHHVWRTTERIRADEEAILKEVRGKRVLDYGCGKGDFALKLLAAGAQVDGIDIAENYIEESIAVALKAGYPASQFNFQIMDAHALTFDANSFDYVVGNGILHHLNFELALDEIHRVLKPGGRAIFQEPLAGNPLLRLFRVLTPNARTLDERPFSEKDLAQIDRNWKVENHYYGLISTPVAMVTSVVLRPWSNNPLLKAAEFLEKGLIRAGVLRSWNQYVLFNLVKPKASATG